MKARIVGLLSVAVLGSLVVPAHADPLRVTAGSFQQSNGFFTLVGNGFSLTAADDFALDLPCEPCAPALNQPINLSINLTEGPFTTGFPGTFNGVSYPVTYLNGNLMFSVPTLFSSSMLSLDHTALTVPFSMTGSLVGFTSSAAELAFMSSGSTAGAFVNDTFTGSGTVSEQFAVNPTMPLGSLFDARNVTFQFQASPTPEPASLLLLASGVGLIWRCVRT